MSYMFNTIHITFLYLGPIYMKSFEFECDFYFKKLNLKIFFRQFQQKYAFLIQQYLTHDSYYIYVIFLNK